MNVASAPTIPASSSPLPSALASSSTSPTAGQIPQGTNLLDAFLSLLVGFATQSELTVDDNAGAANTGPQNKKEDKKKDSLPPIIAAIQFPHTESQPAMTLGLPTHVVDEKLTASELTQPATGRSTPPPVDSAGVSAFMAPNAIAADPAVLLVRRSTSNSQSALPQNLQNDSRGMTTGRVVDQPAVLTPDASHSLSPAIDTPETSSDSRAPMAFALRLEEFNSGELDARRNAPASSPVLSRDSAIEATPSSHLEATPPVHLEVNAPVQSTVQMFIPHSGTERATAPRLEAPAGPHSSIPAPRRAAEDQSTVSGKVPNTPEANVGQESNEMYPQRQAQTAPKEQNVRRLAHADPASADAGVEVRTDEQAGPPQMPHAVLAEMPSEPNVTKSMDSPAPPPPDSQPVRAEEPTVADTNVRFTAQPTREISMRLNPAESPAVDIKLVDRAGSVRVAVRTPDADLARNLQSGLSDLVHRLERKGFDTETWSPGESAGPTMAPRMGAHGNEANSQNGAKNSRDGMQQGGNGRQNNGKNRPKWVTELEQKLAGTDVGE